MYIVHRQSQSYMCTLECIIHAKSKDVWFIPKTGHCYLSSSLFTIDKVSCGDTMLKSTLQFYKWGPSFNIGFALTIHPNLICIRYTKIQTDHGRGKIHRGSQNFMSKWPILLALLPSTADTFDNQFTFCIDCSDEQKERNKRKTLNSKWWQHYA